MRFDPLSFLFPEVTLPQRVVLILVMSRMTGSRHRSTRIRDRHHVFTIGKMFPAGFRRDGFFINLQTSRCDVPESAKFSAGDIL